MTHETGFSRRSFLKTTAATAAVVGLGSNFAFAQGSSKLRVGLILTRRVTSHRWVKVERYSPHCFGHYFDLCRTADLDEELRALANEAYRTGMQDRAG